MTTDDDKAPRAATKRGRDQAAERARRSAEALRVNLSRRKAQQRAQDGLPVAADGKADDPPT